MSRLEWAFGLTKAGPERVFGPSMARLEGIFGSTKAGLEGFFGTPKAVQAGNRRHKLGDRLRADRFRRASGVPLRGQCEDRV